MAEQIQFFDRYEALGIPVPGPLTMRKGRCEGTGVVPVYIEKGDKRIDNDCREESETDPQFVVLWETMELKNPCDDGWHFIMRPTCNGTGLHTKEGE